MLSRSNRVRITVLLLATGALLAACGTRENNQLGVALIDEQGGHAVQLLEIDAPDTVLEFVLEAPPATAGQTSSMLVGARPGYRAQGLIRYDAASLPDSGTAVDSAYVDLRIVDGYGATSPLRVHLHHVLSDWSEATAADPDSFPQLDAVPFATVELPFEASTVDTFRIDFASLAQSWVDSPDTTNFGFALVPDVGADAEVELSTHEIGQGAKLHLYTTVDDSVRTQTIQPSADAALLEATSAYVPPIGFPRRLSLARGWPSRILMKFDWPDPGERATINRAELVLHVDGASSESNGFQVTVQKVTAEPWAADSTEVDGLFHGLTTVNADTDSVTFTMTGVIDDLLTEPNHGFLVRAFREATDTDVLRFHGADTEATGKEPSLRIWYTPGAGVEETR